jgi:hypothetical protein
MRGDDSEHFRCRNIWNCVKSCIIGNGFALHSGIQVRKHHPCPRYAR